MSVPQSPLVDVSVTADDMVSPAALSQLREDVPFEGVWLVQAPGPADDPVLTMTASCEEIQRFVHGTTTSHIPPAAPFRCSPDTVYWARDIVRGHAVPPAGSDRAVAMPSPMRAILDVDALDTRASASVMSVPAGSGSSGHGGTDPTVVFRVPHTQVDAVVGVILAGAPYSQPTVTGLDPDSGQNIAMINGFIRLALLIGLCLGGMALLTGLVDRASERRGADYELLAVGASPAFVRGVHRAELGLTLGVALVTALAGGVLGGLAWQLGGGLVRTPDVQAILLLVASTAAAAVLTVALAERAAPASLDPTALRQD